MKKEIIRKVKKPRMTKYNKGKYGRINTLPFEWVGKNCIVKVIENDEQRRKTGKT